MNAVLNQFEVMDDIKLSSVEGGGWVRCALGTAGSAGLGLSLIHIYYFSCF